MPVSTQPAVEVGSKSISLMAIDARGLVKEFNTAGTQVLAVNNLDLQVEQGTIYALLGPNGAGKTTAINLLITLLKPTRGTALVGGFDVVEQSAQVRSLIGVTFQETIVDKSLSGRELLEVHGRLYRMTRADIKAQIAELVQLVELGDKLDRPVKTYSGGMKRRLELARGLMTRPEVLFLDEPTQGLDPQNRDRIWSYIRELRAKSGTTIFLTTHYMDEAEQLADKVGIIDAGRLVAEGSPPELISRMGSDVISLSGVGNPEKYKAGLQHQDFVIEVLEYKGQTDGQSLLQVSLLAPASRLLKPVIELAENSGFQVLDISIKRPSLNDVFLKYTGRRLRD